MARHVECRVRGILEAISAGDQEPKAMCQRPGTPVRAADQKCNFAKSEFATGEDLCSAVRLLRKAFKWSLCAVLLPCLRR